MASLTINFQATTTGNHFVGYREIHTDPAGVFTVITVACPTLGNYNAQIDVDGSLYCEELEYEGYIIAECQDQTEGPNAGVPAAAIVWSQVLDQQPDPCTLTTLTCISVAVQSVVVNIQGAGYAVNDVIPFVEATVGDEIAPGFITVASVGALGEITAITLTDPGLWLAPPNLDATGSGNGQAQIATDRMAACPDIEMINVACTGIDSNNKTGVTLNQGESIIGCYGTDLEALEQEVGPQIDILQDGNCKCKGCESITLDATAATTGVAVVQYNRCWDRGAGEVLVIADLAFGETITDCIITGSYQTTSNNLDQPIAVSSMGCPSNA